MKKYPLIILGLITCVLLLSAICFQQRITIYEFTSAKGNSATLLSTGDQKQQPENSDTKIVVMANTQGDTLFSVSRLSPSTVSPDGQPLWADLRNFRSLKEAENYRDYLENKLKIELTSFHAVKVIN